jgi:UDP-2,3-diacylglucosamine pyrophosphatase LpxH
MHRNIIFRHLKNLFDNSYEVSANENTKIVILSDLHIGDGSSNDDFLPNSEIFIYILENYYIAKGYSIILNGDIEELLKYKLKKIKASWEYLFELLLRMEKNGKLFKIIGNHDLELLLEKSKENDFRLYHGLKIKWNGDYIFVFHGHQASKKYLRYNKLLGITLKYLAKPLGIKNFSVSHNSRKQYSIEKKVYQFSASHKLVSVIGHTHRPLFESLSKAERLKFKIEQLCRDFASSENEEEKKKIKKSIKNYKRELKKIHKKEKTGLLPGNLYDSLFNIPCLFNSGCVVGKRGFTSLEMDKGSISLVHWFDKNISKKYLINTGYDPDQFKDTNYYRMVVNQESLDYIFTRIKLLA